MAKIIGKDKKYPPEDEHLEYKDYYIIFNKSKCKDVSNKIQIHNEKEKSSKLPCPITNVPDELKKEIGALLNNNIQNGIPMSYIYIGVNDNRVFTLKRQKSYTDDVRARIQERIQGWINTCYYPSADSYIHIDIDAGKNRDHPICIKIISPKHRYFLTKYKKRKSDKNPWKFFIRIGSSSTEPSTLEDRCRIMSRAYIYDYEMEPCSYKKPLTFNYLSKICKRENLSLITLEHKCGFFTSRNQFSNTAFSFSDQNPLIIKIHDEELHYTRIFKKSIIKEINFIMNYVNTNWNNYFPSMAVKEAIINAFAHCSYYLSKREFLEVFISKNRLLVSSPGIIPGDLSIKSVCSGESFLRNPSIFKLLHEIEYKDNQKYCGLSTIINCYNKRFNEESKISPLIWCNYKEGRTNVLLPSKLMIFNGQHTQVTSTFIEPTSEKSEVREYISSINNHKDQVMLYLKKIYNHIQRKDVEEICSVKHAQATRILKNLFEAGLINKSENIRGSRTYYFLGNK